MITGSCFLLRTVLSRGGGQGQVDSGQYDGNDPLPKTKTCFRKASSTDRTPCLKILLGVPVTVVDNHCVCRCQIDAKTSRSSGQKKEPEIGIGIEAAHVLLSLLQLDRTVESAWILPFLGQVIVQDVQHPLHLRKDQDFVSIRLQTPQDSVEQLKLAALF